MKFKYLNLYLKIYVTMALIAAAALSQLALSFVPVLLLFWYLYQWRRPVSALIDFLTQYFIFFAIAALFSTFVPYYLAPLASLPVLILMTNSLEKTTPKMHYRETGHQRNLTGLAVTSLLIVFAVFFISLAVTNLTLIIASAIVLLYFIALGIFIHNKFPASPVREEQVQQRILAGKEEHIQVKLNIKTAIGGLLWVKSTQDWAKVNSGVLRLKGDFSLLKVSIRPALSGPTVVKLKGYAVDRWGLWQSNFEMEPVRLYVIPRARYAAWLAQKYISGSSPGALPMLSNFGALKARQGLRRGIEYYGNRIYQPGDSLKNISWKHTAKYDELIVKEFTEFQGQPAIMLINLAAGNVEEADKLAYNIILSAITLAQENIPAALAVYNLEKVVLTTGVLPSLQLLTRSLQVVKEMVILNNPVKYLNAPDILRLRNNIRRTSQSDSRPARVLTELLRLEYQSLSHNARINPCTKALSEVMSRASKQSNVVVLSQRNHDAEALAFNHFTLTQKGNAVIYIE